MKFHFLFKFDVNIYVWIRYTTKVQRNYGSDVQLLGNSSTIPVARNVTINICDFSHFSKKHIRVDFMILITKKFTNFGQSNAGIV